MKKIINYKNMSTSQRIIFLVIVVSILAILTWILRTINVNKQIQKNAIITNYNEIEDFSYFMAEGIQTYDRQVYWDLNDIIAGYIQSVKYVGDSDDFSTDNYYEALTTEYKSFLGEKKYKEISMNFIKKFEITGVQEVNYKIQDFIDEVYDLNNDMYFCKLKGIDNKEAYIGIKLNTNKKTFQIFYIE